MIHMSGCFNFYSLLQMSFIAQTFHMPVVISCSLRWPYLLMTWMMTTGFFLPAFRHIKVRVDSCEYEESFSMFVGFVNEVNLHWLHYSAQRSAGTVPINHVRPYMTNFFFGFCLQPVIFNCHVFIFLCVVSSPLVFSTSSQIYLQKIYSPLPVLLL